MSHTGALHSVFLDINTVIPGYFSPAFICSVFIPFECKFSRFLCFHCALREWLSSCSMQPVNSLRFLMFNQLSIYIVSLSSCFTLSPIGLCIGFSFPIFCYMSPMYFFIFSRGFQDINPAFHSITISV